MFESHWGLAGQPFQPTPDPAFWFETAAHRRAAAYLDHALAQREGFVVLTGAAGTGKTVLIARLLQAIDPETVQVVQLSPGDAAQADLLRDAAAQLGIAAMGPSRADLVTSIERGLRTAARTGKRTVIVADAAHRLPVAALEELRLLSSLEIAGHALAQIVLVGAPALRERLERSEGLDRLRRQVIAIHQLEPMGGKEIPAYVAHRLMLVGWRGRPDFAEDAFPALHAETGGVPRQVNLLAGRAMLHAAIAGTDLIDAAVVSAAAGAAAPPERDQPGQRIGSAEPLDARIAELEARLEQQDAALRRLLQILVDLAEVAPPDATRIRAA